MFQARTAVLAKHSKSFLLIDCVSVGVDRMQRNFEPMRKQVEAWQRSELTDVTAKLVIYVVARDSATYASGAFLNEKEWALPLKFRRADPKPCETRE